MSEERMDGAAAVPGRARRNGLMFGLLVFVIALLAGGTVFYVSLLAK